MTQSLNDSMLEFFQRRLRLLQIFRIESFGEPVVDFGQHGVRLVALALLPPQAGKTRRSAQFEESRLLLASDFQCFIATCCRLCLGIRDWGFGGRGWRRGT